MKMSYFSTQVITKTERQPSNGITNEADGMGVVCILLVESYRVDLFITKEACLPVMWLLA